MTDALEYTIVLEEAEDGGWSALAPDLPGLLIAGDTREPSFTKGASNICLKARFATEPFSEAADELVVGIIVIAFK